MNCAYIVMNGHTGHSRLFGKFLSQVVYGPLWLRKFIFKHYGNRLSELLADIITEKKKTYSIWNPS